MLIHKIKIQKKYFDKIITGEKTFEVRKNDRDYRKGDCVQFTVLDGAAAHDDMHLFEIIYVLNDFCGLADGYVAFSIKQIK